jgi:hypothetical protein
MIEPCNFKSPIRHEHACGCDLTPKDNVCPGEEHCVLYQIYAMLVSKHS